MLNQLHIYYDILFVFHLQYNTKVTGYVVISAPISVCFFPAYIPANVCCCICNKQHEDMRKLFISLICDGSSTVKDSQKHILDEFPGLGVHSSTLIV